MCSTRISSWSAWRSRTQAIRSPCGRTGRAVMPSAIRVTATWSASGKALVITPENQQRWVLSCSSRVITDGLLPTTLDARSAGTMNTPITGQRVRSSTLRGSNHRRSKSRKANGTATRRSSNTCRRYSSQASTWDTSPNPGSTRTDDGSLAAAETTAGPQES